MACIHPTMHNHIPPSLDGRGIKGEGDNKTVPPHRHTGFKAVSTGRGDNKTDQPPIPLSLDGRGIKGEGEPHNTNHLSHGQPTAVAHVTDCTRNNHPYPTIPQHRPNPLNPDSDKPLHHRFCIKSRITVPKMQPYGISTVRATAPASISLNASLTSDNGRVRVTKSSRFNLPRL